METLPIKARLTPPASHDDQAGVRAFGEPHYLPVRLSKREVGDAHLHDLGPYLPRLFV